LIWILFIVWLFAARVWISPAAPTSDKTVQVADFNDVAKKAGLTATNVFGEKDHTTYVLESTGTGVAIFDYDNDGWPDIFLVNGSTLKGFPVESAPTNHLYRNNHDGSFTDVTSEAGLVATGWGQGVCVGDFDNDGWEDLYVTYYGKNRLYHNRHGTFEEVADAAGVMEKLGEAAADSWITIGMGSSIWSSRITRTSNLHTPLPLANTLAACGRALPSFVGHEACLAAEISFIAISARAASKT